MQIRLPIEVFNLGDAHRHQHSFDAPAQTSRRRHSLIGACHGSRSEPAQRAEVIKVEPPGTGDPYINFYRTPPNPVCDSNYAWQLTNRNKRGIALDLKSPAAAEVLRELVKWADVFVTNCPPRVRESLKMTYEDVSPLNERLIYADITGYGDFGPEADEPGYDITAYWARSGLMEMTRDAGGDPTLPIPGIGDHATSISLYSAIVTGLYRREKTGKGCRVTTSLIAEGAWAATTWIEGALDGAKFFGLHDRKNPPDALLNPYPTSDGRWLLLVLARQDRDWPSLAAVIGRWGTYERDSPRTRVF